MSLTKLSTTLLAAVAALASPAMLAQTSSSGATAAENNLIEEVVVTAQKRRERLTDVPLSVTTATGEQLAKQGVTSPADLEAIVTGFTYQRSSYGAPVFSIRGIGFLDTALFVAPTVTVYVDQVPLPFSPMTVGATLDLERFEALKGPQGTLFGQNSTGGAINFIAAKPTDTFAAGADLSYGRFSTFEGEGYISGPLAETLSARLAIRAEQGGEWQENHVRDDEHGERDFKTARLLLDWRPTDAVGIELNLNGWQDKSDTQVAQFLLYAPSVPNGLPEQAAFLPTQPLAPDEAQAADWDAGTALERDDQFYQAALHADFEVSDTLTITSITAYSDYEQDSLNDPDGSSFQDFRINKFGSATSFSQELRAAGEVNDGALRWMVGANYQQDRTRDNEVLNPPYLGSNGSVGPFRFNTFLQQNNQDIDTQAVFGSLDFKLSETLTLQTSARYTDQKRDFNGCVFDLDGNLAAAFNLLHSLIGVGGTTAPGGCVTYDTETNFVVPDRVRKDLDEDNLSWRASLNWKPNSDALLYANVTQGYKAGSFATIAAIESDELNPVTQESVLAYEVGFKLSASSNEVQLSGAIFHYDYEDKQILGFYDSPVFGSLPALVNVPESQVNGAEIEVVLQPVAGLRIGAGVTYIDSEVTSSFVTADPFAVQRDIEGERFPNAPEWQANGDIEYSFSLSDRLNAFIGGGGRYRSSSYAAFGETPLFEIEDYITLDLRAGLESPDGVWRAEVWGRNVTDEYYWNNVSHLVDTVARTAGMPATYGVRFSFRR